MRFSSIVVFALTAFAGPRAQTQVATVAVPASAACSKLNQDAVTLVAENRSRDAEDILLSTLANSDGLDPVCAGVIRHNIAALLSISGRLAEAESMAERSVHTLEERLPPDDRALLNPLYILAGVRLERGKIARAREAFRQMQLIRVPRPEDRAVVSAMAARLLCVEGRWPEAEVHYSAALEAIKDAGRGDTADAAALLTDFGVLYIQENRMAEARRALDEAFAIFERAAGADPGDRIKVLHVRAGIAILDGRQGDWQKAEEDLAHALAIADRDSRVEPAALKPLLIVYATALRKNHRRREARSIEKRIAAIGGSPGDAAVVDATALLARPKTR